MESKNDQNFIAFCEGIKDKQANGVKWGFLLCTIVLKVEDRRLSK